MTITFKPEKPITITDSLTTEIDDLTVEFSPSETRLSLGKNVVAVKRDLWPHVVAKSAVYDAVLAGSPVPAPLAPISIPTQTNYDDIPFGTPMHGGFFTGYHPVIRNAVFITSPKSMERSDLTWQQAVDYCAGLGDGWKLPDRLESLLQFQRLAQGNAVVDAFQAGGAEVFPEAPHWTSEEYKFRSDYAWLQYFGCGYSGYWLKLLVLRVRPGRIFFL